MSSDGSSQWARRPPHITVNSGSGGNLLDYQPDSSQLLHTTNASRQLLPLPRSGSDEASGSSAGSSGYGTPNEVQSEMLLPPSIRTRGHRDYFEVPTDSQSGSAMSSRRTSVSSNSGRSGRSRDSRLGPFASPFDDSRTPSRAGSADDEGINTQTVSEKYNIMPSAGLLLYPEDVEKDDWLHNPDPNDPDKIRCDIWNKRGLVNVGGLAFITLGILVLFVGYPIISFVQKSLPPTLPPLAPTNNATNTSYLSQTMPLLQNLRSGLIDPDTPKSAMTKMSHDGVNMKLVFSDEFNKPGRTFYPGDDPFFEAVDIWYGATQDLEWYDPDAVSTDNGTLNIRFDAFQSHFLNYRSGMLQSWNKLCFKGGRLEASISLPGRGDIEGFWPGFWAMGNLGRPGYISTSEGLWPYSYWDKCDLGITPNQSSADGLSRLPGMRLPACTCKGQDHPSPGNSRSAPEIDALEASVGFMGAAWSQATGSASQSFQAAPFDIWYQPDYNFLEVYDNSITSMNTYRGGPYQEALSGVTWLNNDWYDGKEYQTYGFEYTPGASGDITWFVGDHYTWHMDSRALRPNGNVGQRTVPQEPMSVILNLGLSNSFAEVFLANLAELMPATMRFDYVRIYQDPSNIQVTCDPPGYPTTEYISQHAKAYTNPNFTTWEQAGFQRPTNSFENGCQT